MQAEVPLDCWGVRTMLACPLLRKGVTSVELRAKKMCRHFLVVLCIQCTILFSSFIYVKMFNFSPLPCISEKYFKWNLKEKMPIRGIFPCVSVFSKYYYFTHLLKQNWKVVIYCISIQFVYSVKFQEFYPLSHKLPTSWKDQFLKYIY